MWLRSWTPTPATQDPNIRKGKGDHAGRVGTPTPVACAGVKAGGCGGGFRLGDSEFPDSF